MLVYRKWRIEIELSMNQQLETRNNHWFLKTKNTKQVAEQKNKIYSFESNSFTFNYLSSSI